MLFFNFFVASIIQKSKSKWGFICLAHVNQLCTLINFQYFPIEPFEYIQSLCGRLARGLHTLNVTSIYSWVLKNGALPIMMFEMNYTILAYF